MFPFAFKKHSAQVSFAATPLQLQPCKKHEITYSQNYCAFQEPACHVCESIVEVAFKKKVISILTRQLTRIAVQKRQASTPFPCPPNLTSSPPFFRVHSERAL